MSQRSLQVRPECIPQVQSAFIRHGYESQKAFAEDVEVSLDTVRKFLKGKQISRQIFQDCCKRLGLDWKAIANLDPQDSNIRPAPASDEPQQPTSLQLASDPNFVGRESAIANLNTLVNQGAKVILIHAKGGVGKTTLAQNYLQQQFGSYIEFPIAKETQNITSVESLIEERLKQLGEEPGREFGVSLDRLKRKLQTARIGVLIDNLEPALDGNGKIIEPHRRYVELLTALADPQLQSVTLITSRECIRESAVTVRHYRLEGLDLAAWQEFFNNCLKTPLSPPASGGGNLAPLLVGGDGGGQIVELSPALTAMHKAYGGNAKAMEILSSAIVQEYDNNIETFWQEIQEDLLSLGELEDLVAYQFNRLQKLNLDPYKLLCRMGCYRYQDVRTVPIEGLLCLLWDVLETQHQRVVRSLRDRSLVEFKNGEYWLHPVIRSEAIARLKASEDWETANRKAAEFWTESVTAVETVKDALRALEAYYHYIEIHDIELAGSVIAKERANKWEKDEALGRAFYRFGLLKQMMFLITRIIKCLNPGYNLSSLYNILGCLYWMTGNIQEAVDCHEKSKKIAIEFSIPDFEIVALYNIGLCKIDVWELNSAESLFELAISLAENTPFHNYAVESYFCMAFVNSCLGKFQQAFQYSEKFFNEPLGANRTAWSVAYSLLFLGLTYKNLGKSEKSFEMYNQAITYAEETHYTQVKALALTGIAALYREQRDFETALSHHSESIENLKKIGAKCDLAEAYYQLGLTYQKIGDTQKSQENFDTAIQLFSEMEAPKQVEKVEQARDSGG